MNMQNILVSAIIVLMAVSSCSNSGQKSQQKNTVNNPQEKKTKAQKCEDYVLTFEANREAKIAKLARMTTLGGGAKYGSGGIGQAYVEAEIWADEERSKLQDIVRKELKRCNK